MSTQPVTLDFSKAQPIAAPQQPQAQGGGGVTLDFGKAVPIDSSQSLSVDSGETDAAETGKNAIWSQAASDFHSGNYFRAAKTLLGVLSPSKNPAMQRSIDQMAQAGIGAAKSAGQSLNDIGDVATLGTTHLISRTPEQKQQQDRVFAPSNPAQQAGGDLETILEFMSGDEALKGLSLAAKLSEGSKLVSFLEKYPRLAGVLGSAIRGGAVGGTVGAIHQGPEGAVKGAEMGAAFGGGSELAGELANVPKMITKALSAKDVQEGLQGAVRGIVDDVAGKAGVTAPQSKSVLGAIEETGDKVHALSKAQYRQLDEASGGTWQRFDTKLRTIRQRMTKLDPDLDSDQWENLETQKTEAELAQQNTVDQLISEGKITKELGQQASANYKQANALWDTKAALKPAVKGANPDVVLSGKNPELADPEQFFRRVDKLHDSGRLQDALGQDAADKLYRTANDAVVRYRQVVRNQKIAKVAGGAIGAGALTKGVAGYFQNKLSTQ